MYIRTVPNSQPNDINRKVTRFKSKSGAMSNIRTVLFTTSKWNQDFESGAMPLYWSLVTFSDFLISSHPHPPSHLVILFVEKISSPLSGRSIDCQRGKPLTLLCSCIWELSKFDTCPTQVRSLGLHRSSRSDTYQVTNYFAKRIFPSHSTYW